MAEGSFLLWYWKFLWTFEIFCIDIFTHFVLIFIFMSVHSSTVQQLVQNWLNTANTSMFKVSRNTWNIKVWNIFKGNNKDTRMTLLTSFFMSFMLTFNIFHTFWTLDVSWTASYEIPLVRLSVCPSVTTFFHDWIISFFWYCAWW